MSPDQRQNWCSKKQNKQKKSANCDIWREVDSTLFSLTLSTAQLCIVSGMLNSWPSPFILKITQDKENYNITEDEASYFTVIHTIGIFVLSPFLVPVLKMVGRKPMLISVAVPYTISLILKAVFTNLWVIYLSRLIFGFGEALILPSFAAYVGEISVPKIRGKWGTSFSCFCYFGALIINIIGTYLNVQETSYVGLGIIFTFLITFTSMPESPYFLITHNRDVEAKDSLRFLRRIQNVDDEFLQIKTAVERQMSESGKWKDLSTVKANRKGLLAGILMRIGQQFSGWMVFTTYTQYMFEKATIDIKSSTAAQIYSGIVFFTCVGSVSFSDRLGRRKSFILSLFLSSIVLLGESAYFIISEKFPEVNTENVQWLPILGMMLFVLTATFGIGLSTVLISSELFSVGIKAHAMSILNMNYAFTYFATNYLFYLINSYTGLYGPFLFFSLCDIVSMFLAYVYIPETSGKTLQEIQIMLNKM